MSKEEMNQELSTDELKDVASGVVDFGGSQFKPKANKGWWTVDGAENYGSIRNAKRILHLVVLVQKLVNVVVAIGAIRHELKNVDN
tara:strand:- start:242 stop:499 length:258 start_codon:yes stop_codon:yes gene_type:complete